MLVPRVAIHFYICAQVWGRTGTNAVTKNLILYEVVFTGSNTSIEFNMERRGD